MKSQSQLIVPLSVGGAAALLSILTGFISGIPVGGILTRALLSGVLGGGFAFLAGWLVMTYLPELAALNESKSDGETPAPEPRTGQRVNIVMEDDGPSEGSQSSSGTNSQDSEPGQKASNDNEIAESGEILHNNKPDDSDSINDLVDNLDALPNMDSLEINMGGSASDTADESDSIDSVSEESPASETSLSSGTSVNPGEKGDPSEIAKAVRTVLARDQQK